MKRLMVSHKKDQLYDLYEVLSPIQKDLNNFWWYLNGNGSSFCDEMTDKEFQDLLKEFEVYTLKFGNYTVGKPGWFSKFAKYADGDWAIYFAINSKEIPNESFDVIEIIYEELDIWFSSPVNWKLPESVDCIARNIDDSFWDIFINSESLFKVLIGELSKDSLLEVKEINNNFEPTTAGDGVPPPPVS